MTRLTTYPDASTFLAQAGELLEQRPDLNHLMLGICERLVRYPERIEQAPFLAQLESEGHRWAAVMTPPHNVLLSAGDPWPDECLRTLADALLKGNWQVPGVMSRRDAAAAFTQLFTSLTGRAYTLTRGLLSYSLDEVCWAPTVPGALRQSTAEDLDTALYWSIAFHRESLPETDESEARRVAERMVGEGSLHLWEDDKVVSMAGWTRPTRKAIAVTLVYTPPALRGRGYASACVAALSRKLLNEGYAFCTLYADAANPTSNSIYQKIGYRETAEWGEYAFAPAPASAGEPQQGGSL